jgi:fatty acid desaturase
VGLLILLPVVIYQVQDSWLWFPLALWQGFVVFSFSVLLHEVVHKTVFSTQRPWASKLLGLCYGAISGLSASQFTKWHLDHHRELGSTSKDPKRAYLSPKRNARWFKFLYFTPALFPLYFRAAARAQGDYAPWLRRRILRERMFVFLLHGGVLAFMWSLDATFAMKAYVVPVVFVFPIAFALNRLGQHYVIDPDNIAAASTLMRSHRIWDFLFLYSTYHLEHHYFPSVPFYRLKALHRALGPFFRQQEMPMYTYGKILKLWFFDNHLPHSLPGGPKA